MVLNQDATEGSDLALLVSEETKSARMARCDGVNLPYQMKFTEMRPVRRAPLWYLMLSGTSFTRAVGFLAP